MGAAPSTVSSTPDQPEQPRTGTSEAKRGAPARAIETRSASAVNVSIRHMPVVRRQHAPTIKLEIVFLSSLIKAVSNRLPRHLCHRRPPLPTGQTRRRPAAPPGRRGPHLSGGKRRRLHSRRHALMMSKKRKNRRSRRVPALPPAQARVIGARRSMRRLVTAAPSMVNSTRATVERPDPSRPTTAPTP